jgi:UDP-N-acetylmuramyl pentapeptide synthase
MLGRNKVYLNKHNCIEILVNGDQTAESVQTMADQAVELGNVQRAAGNPILILDNLTKIGAVPPDARKRVVELAKSLQYDKLAMVGKGTAIRLGANLMLQAVGKGRTVKYFDNYDKAIEWLQNNTSGQGKVE